MRQLIVITFMLVVAMPVHAERFELFVTDENEYTQPGVTVYRINGGDRLMVSINDQLKRDGVTREADGERYVTEALKHALANQAIGLVKAGQYKLSYFPALVIDGQFVVYGTTRVDAYYRLKNNG